MTVVAVLLQAEHLTSCYWGGSSNPTERHDPSLPYLEQYRIDMEQFKVLFKLLFPWANGAHSDPLALRFFRLLDQNGDGLINFREFICGLGKDVVCRLLSLLIYAPLSLFFLRQPNSEPLVVASADVLCHGDLTEKLKLLYKMHVIPGQCVVTHGDC